ncbi:hypothetical protein E0500_021635 [Streptomyces sp. KM273126]|uniref:hypothetical protein n=1 Tax=Streptomyces sp. KM273126 TaxID=2545247 RepID=UPI0015EB2ECB|nr:hypothetical protein [Streptomyces sp. KM273126]MBA2809931.1 hypothetical protein [Streptomyces sp. KM273126]
MGRRAFLATTTATTVGITEVPDMTTSVADAAEPQLDADFLEFLTTAADARAAALLTGYQAHITELRERGRARSTARALRTLTSTYVHDGSAYHHSAELLAPMAELAGALADEQEDGLWDHGTGGGSPPDTAFSIVDLNLTYHLLDGDGHRPTVTLRGVIERVLRAAGPALATGGLHTANHRWLVCAALARIHRRWPHPSYRRRIDDWLAEGIDQLPGGEYSERSPTYSAVVTNPALLVLARHHGRADLYENVRANLAATLYVIEPNGEVESVHSRRQDQTALRYLPEFWMQYRELAIRYGDGRFAAVARLLRERGAGQTFGETPLGERLAQVLDQPELARRLPEPAELPTDFEHHDAGCGLVRVRRGARTASIFGGTDFPDVRAISSGLSTNPTFFKLRKGAAILDSVRLAPQFFSLGHFRAEGLERTGDGWRLHAEMRGTWHHPLPRAHRREDGAYPLTDDGRFWSAMDFPHRPNEYRTLRTEILVKETGDGAWDLHVGLSGAACPFALELCFRRGGTLSGDGLEPVGGSPDTYQLVTGEASYTVGDDRITFGPGNGKGGRQPAVVDAGERYSWMNGALVPDGVRVLITGRSPLSYRLGLR